MKDTRCSACGHARVFHQIGTGTGVPVGREYCDDRHSDPCSCQKFIPIKAINPLKLSITVPYDPSWKILEVLLSVHCISLEPNEEPSPDYFIIEVPAMERLGKIIEVLQTWYKHCVMR